MSVIRFRTTLKGDLPHLSYIFRKLEPLGTEFNTFAWSITGALIFLGIQRGKGQIKSSRYHLELGDTAACTKIFMGDKTGLGQRYLKESTKYFFIFNSWLLSKNSVEAAASIGVDLIGMVKTNTKGFCKATVEGSTKDWPGGSYIVLRRKPILPGERWLLNIVYKYNSRKVLSFFSTEGAGSTTLGIPYLSKYPDQFSNVSVSPVACTLIMSKFFGLVNKVESHNKSRNPDIVLDKLWVTQCGWLR